MRYEIDKTKKEITLLEPTLLKDLFEELGGLDLSEEWIIKGKTDFNIAPLYPIYPTFPQFPQPVIPQQPVYPWWDQPYYTVNCTVKQ